MKPNDANPLQNAEPYLTEEQLFDVRASIENVKSGKEEEGQILKLVDGYVRANGRADEAYNGLRSLSDKALDLMSSELPYPEQVKMTLFPISLMAYFSLLLLVGVYTGDELNVSMKELGQATGHRNNEA